MTFFACFAKFYLLKFRIEWCDVLWVVGTGWSWLRLQTSGGHFWVQ